MNPQASVFFSSAAEGHKAWPGALIARHHLLALAVAQDAREHFDPVMAATELYQSAGDAGILAAIVLEAQARGHACLPLAALPAWWQEALAALDASVPRPRDDAPLQPHPDRILYCDSLDPGALASLVQNLASTAPALWGTGAPFIVEDGTGGPSFCTRRQRAWEEGLAKVLSTRFRESGRAASPIKPVTIPLRPASAVDASTARDVCAAQAAAANASLQHRLYVLSGGPGTGKTTTVCYLLLAWYRSGVRRVGLGAPTGRAAQRLKGSLVSSLDQALEPDAAGRPLDPELAGEEGFADFIRQLAPATVHRWVGRGKTQGLELSDLELLIIDEASMLDAELASLVLGGLDPRASLILVGDHRQLPAVEDGSIMADLSRLAHRDGKALWFAHLEHSMRAGDAVLALPRKLAADEPASSIIKEFATLPGLEGGEGPVRWQRLQGRDSRDKAERQKLVEAIVARHRFPPNAKTIEADLGKAVVLCDRHDGFWGSRTINALALEAWNSSGQRSPNAPWLHGIPLSNGLPLIIRRNDASLGVFNGDRGLAWSDDGTHFKLLLPNERHFSVEVLPEFELSFAMTIHKSQGSEFNHVDVLLDSHGTMGTRELLYTGLTRARHSWTLYASPAALEHNVQHHTLRHSRLIERIGQG